MVDLNNSQPRCDVLGVVGPKAECWQNCKRIFDVQLKSVISATIVRYCEIVNQNVYWCAYKSPS